MIDNRIVWIDNVKAIGIFLVVLGHLFIKEGWVMSFIYSFHMPLFFFVSGILFKNNMPFGVLVKKNVKRLLIPYVSFYALSYIWWIYFVFIRNSSGTYPDPSFYECIVKPFTGMFLGAHYTTEISYFVNTALWFLIALFEVKIITYLILKIRNNYLMIISIILIPLFYIYTDMHQITMYFSIPNMTCFFLFFIGGYYTRNIFIKLSGYSTGIKALAISLILIIIQLFLAYHLKVMPVKSITDYIIFSLLAISGIFFIFYLSNISGKQNKIMKLISDNTMTIMCIHIPINGLITGSLKNLFNMDTSAIPAIIAIFIAITSLACSLIAAKFFRKYIPIIIGEKKQKEISSHSSGNSSI